LTLISDAIEHIKKRVIPLVACLALTGPANAEDQLQEPAADSGSMFTPLLQGFAKQDSSDESSTGKLLFGGIQERLSALTAIQHKRASTRFKADLTALCPMFATSPSKTLQGQISHSRPLLEAFVDKKRPLFGEIKTERPIDDLVLRRGRPTLDNDIASRERPLPDANVSLPDQMPVIDVTLPMRPSAALNSRHPQTDGNYVTDAPITDDTVHSAPTDDSIVPRRPNLDTPPISEPRTRDLKNKSNPDTELLATEKPSDDNYAHRDRHHRTTDLDLGFKVPSADTSVHSRLHVPDGAVQVENRINRRSLVDDLALQRPDEQVSGLLRHKDNISSITSRPESSDVSTARKPVTDTTIIAEKPDLDTDIALLRKKQRQTEITRQRPNFEVVFSRTNNNDADLETDARIASHKPAAIHADSAHAQSRQVVEQSTDATLSGKKLERDERASLAELTTKADKVARAKAKEEEALRARQSKLESQTSKPDSKVSWDNWYAEVSRLCEPLLTDAVDKHGNPAGANCIQITVWRDHHLIAKLVKGQNKEFNDTMLEAYRMLDGNGALEFPSGSKRQKVSFFVDNKHDSTDPVYGVESRSIVGDQETANEE